MTTTCKKYSHSNVPCKYRKIVNDLSRDKYFGIMKQDKGIGVVVMDRGKDLDECLAMLNTEQLVQLQKDPTNSLERKVQHTLQKIKQLPADVYAKPYQTGSTPRKAHNLAEILSPLSRSQYTVESSIKFAYVVKQHVIPSFIYKLVLFDIKSLFPNLPLDRTIDIILKTIYKNHEITTNIGCKDMEDLITLCTRNVPFTFNNDIYQQRDGIVMRSPLQTILSGIIRLSLKTLLSPS